LNVKTKLSSLFLLTGIALLFLGGRPAFAWLPKGEISKMVQNQTAGGELVEANTADLAITAKKGDVLRYVIEIKNTADANSASENDMAYVVMTDVLPDGIELVDDKSKREIKESLGTIKPGEKVALEYLLRVSETQNGVSIENKACFLGDSTVKDNPQSGCDSAYVATKQPVVVIPEPPRTPASPPQVAAKTETKTLPNTGGEDVVVFAVISGVAGYISSIYMKSSRFGKNKIE
jgi:uncharacterized repeat protein (TIGR01451 family)